MKLIIDISEKDYLECVKRVEEIREKGYMIENLKYKMIIVDGIPLEEIQNPCIECSQNCCVCELNGEKCECQKVYVVKENINELPTRDIL